MRGDYVTEYLNSLKVIAKSYMPKLHGKTDRHIEKAQKVLHQGI